MPEQPTIGRTLPQNTSVPRVQRKMPAPFTRPSITIGGDPAAPKRAWRRILACNVEPGDTVAGFGRVDHVDDTIAGVGQWNTMLRRDEDDQVTSTVYSATDVVFAFTTTGPRPA